MTEEEQERFTVAELATIAAAAGAQKAEIADNVTLLLLPLLRSLDVYKPASVTAFAALAAQYVEMGRQEAAKVTYAALQSRMTALGVEYSGSYEPVAAGRTTPLAEAYERPAAAYRLRMSKGVDSIKGLIFQAEEERYQQLGGDAAAKERTGESNAEVEARKGSQGASGKAPSASSGSSAGKSSSSGSSTSGAGGADRGAQVRKAPKDVDLSDPDDFDPGEEGSRRANDAEEARERELDAEFDAQQELRDQARLSEEEKQLLLQQQAQQDMEIRAERMVNDDLGMASRDSYRDALQKTPKQVIGYRRILRPELSRYGTSCGLCVAASTRVYKKKDLLAMHNLCNCEVIEVVGSKDYGQQINDDDLLTLYSEAGSTDRADLKAQKYEVFEHPELGPVLRNAKHKKKNIQFNKTGSNRA